MIKVLIIDDEKDFCFMVKLNLEELGGYKVITAYSGTEGIKKVHWYRPDVILLDITMPNMDGIEVLKSLRANIQFINTPIIMLTARNTDEYKIKSAGQCVDRYLVKPVQTEAIKAAVDSALDKKRNKEQEV